MSVTVRGGRIALALGLAFCLGNLAAPDTKVEVEERVDVKYIEGPTKYVDRVETKVVTKDLPRACIEYADAVQALRQEVEGWSDEVQSTDDKVERLRTLITDPQQSNAEYNEAKESMTQSEMRAGDYFMRAEALQNTLDVLEKECGVSK